MKMDMGREWNGETREILEILKSMNEREKEFIFLLKSHGHVDKTKITHYENVLPDLIENGLVTEAYTMFLKEPSTKDKEKPKDKYNKLTLTARGEEIARYITANDIKGDTDSERDASDEN